MFRSFGSVLNKMSMFGYAPDVFTFTAIFTGLRSARVADVLKFLDLSESSNVELNFHHDLEDVAAVAAVAAEGVTLKEEEGVEEAVEEVVEEVEEEVVAKAKVVGLAEVEATEEEQAVVESAETSRKGDARTVTGAVLTIAHRKE
ncbi:hypothetical protein TrVE_jg1495 [Triparma verrucosa]|uniref:Uncharacterized protein n=1 Tax=Triparma verrucosa TaxID=1606542 RepID=A0A9W7EZT2_9STRA|nr:hypothetical protein TrVE_jg1495 [Triparma verrucosa]